MSADNGIYVAEFPDGYRVIHAMAIDNLWHGTQEEQANTVLDYFSKAKIFSTKGAATQEAFKMLNKELEYGPVEYGVSNIGYFNANLTQQ